MTATFTPLVQLRPPKRTVELKIDGETVQVPEGTTVLEACQQQGKEIPTLCYLETLHPVNVCRACVVEVEGSRVLVPSWSTGKVGTLGGSYNGAIQWLTAVKQPPHLATMIVLATPSDPFVEWPTGQPLPVDISWYHFTSGHGSQGKAL